MLGGQMLVPAACATQKPVGGVPGETIITSRVLHGQLLVLMRDDQRPTADTVRSLTTARTPCETHTQITHMPSGRPVQEAALDPFDEVELLGRFPAGGGTGNTGVSAKMITAHALAWCDPDAGLPWGLCHPTCD